MATDDLGKPLGSNRAGRSKQPWRLPLMPLLAAGMASVLALALLWIMVVDDPLGGEPRAVARIDSPDMSAAGKTSPAPALTENGKKSAEAIKSNGQTVTIIDGKSGSRREVVLSPGVDSDKPVASVPLDPRLSELSRHGTIPRIGADGARPVDVFAKPATDKPAAAGSTERKGARIAIVVGGLGIGAAATNDAIGKLPSIVTLAFTPYGSELSKWVTKARGEGHEILLQVPMEPFDYPDNDPGPQTLLSTISAEQNLDRLHWFLSRTQGYVGVTNFMGARFTANDAALAPVLRDVAKRGLMYLDDSSSQRSQAAKVAADAKLPFLKADIVVDAKPTWQEIDQALERLEKIASEQGHAIGTASALPISIERIARWAKAAEARGVIIVPVSAVLARSKQS